MYSIRHGLQRRSTGQPADERLLERPGFGLPPRAPDDRIEREAGDLLALPVPHRERAGLEIAVAEHDDVRRLQELGGADLLADRLLRVVDRDTEPGSAGLGSELARRLDVPVGDRQHRHLHGRQPRGERARVVLGEDGEEPLDRAEQRAVDHHRRWRSLSAPTYSSSKRCGSWKSSWIVDICHVRPMASRACTRDLRPVERAAAFVHHELEVIGLGDLRAAPRWPRPTPRRCRPPCSSGLVDSSR